MYTYLNETWFFTATINNWQQLFSNESRIGIFLDSLRYFCEKKRIQLHAFVIMPNHVHLILTFHEKETMTSFQRDLLKFTSQLLIRLMIRNGEQEELNRYLSTQKDRIYQIWERRPKWIKIDNTLILEQKMEYIHNNPLQEKWKLLVIAEEYPWSSASYYANGNPEFSFLTGIAY